MHRTGQYVSVRNDLAVIVHGKTRTDKTGTTIRVRFVTIKRKTPNSNGSVGVATIDREVQTIPVEWITETHTDTEGRGLAAIMIREQTALWDAELPQESTGSHPDDATVARERHLEV